MDDTQNGKNRHKNNWVAGADMNNVFEIDRIADIKKCRRCGKVIKGARFFRSQYTYDGECYSELFTGANGWNDAKLIENKNREKRKTNFNPRMS